MSSSRSPNPHPTMLLQAIHELYAYTRWADDLVVAAVEDLSDEELRRDLGGSFGGVFGTLAHVMWADWLWLERWRGRSHTGPGEAPLELAGLLERWRSVRDERDRFLADLDDDGLRRVVRYTNTKGQPFEGELWRLLMHAANHATYHRGQVVTHLRQLGRPGVTTDLAAWQRGVAAGTIPRGG